MKEVHKTLFIPLYGKARVSKENRILHDPMAEKIWEAEGFPIRGKGKSKWLAYAMAMRARVFDDWTEEMLCANPERSSCRLAAAWTADACGSKLPICIGSTRIFRKCSPCGKNTTRKTRRIG